MTPAKIRILITKLSAVTVSRGATPDEARLALEKIKALQARLSQAQAPPKPEPPKPKPLQDTPPYRPYYGPSYGSSYGPGPTLAYEEWEKLCEVFARMDRPLSEEWIKKVYDLYEKKGYR